MSLTFTQIVREIYKNTKANDKSYPLTDLVQDVNLAWDDALAIAFKSGGTWQMDDSAHTDYPIIYANLISGKREYAFTTDEQGNLILDIYRVFVKNTAGLYQEVFPIDMQSDPGTEAFTDEQEIFGVPRFYDKTANGITFDVTPDSSIYTDADTLIKGIKIMIDREGTYFTTDDTDKKPGFDGLCHEYLAIKPSYKYAHRNNLKNVQTLAAEMYKLEAKIEERYARREKDVVNVITPKKKINYI